MRTISLIPDPTDTVEDHARFWHLDLSTLDDRQLWADEKRVEQALASRIASGRRPRMIWAQPPIDDEGWLVERLGRLQDESQRRGARRAA